MSITLWTPLFSFLVFVLFFAIGDWVSNLTKSKISGMLIAMLLYLVGFQTGIIPATSLNDTGIPTIASNFAIMLLLVGMGTMIHLKEMIAQWKTVVVALVALVGLALCSFTVSSWLFGREWALCASAPISGGIIAGQMTSEAATAAGRPDLAGFAMLVIGCQGFVGIPICNFFVRKYCHGVLAGKITMKEPAEVKDTGKRKLLDISPKWMSGDNTIFLKMALVGWFGWLISQVCSGVPVLSYITNANIMYLVVGIIFCVLGFLPENATVKSHANGFLMLAVLSVIPGSLASLSLSDLVKMIVPLVGTLLVGAVFICLFGAIAGKVLGVHWTIAFAIAICCTIGYPGTQIVVDEVVRSLDCDEETRTRIYNNVLPQIIVSGFTSVTVASVIFAGIVCPMIF
ncbi:MAG TPA: hypothetical protein H9896_01490 [Candidatus Pygmaiobacter gallistercoris]|nr:hypothetical protein [Candidatus Pygmaiobacter gallistercoris]